MLSKILILAFMAAVIVSALPGNETMAIEQGTVPYCSDLLFVDDGSFHEVNCTIKAENANFQFSFPEFDNSDDDVASSDISDNIDDIDTNNSIIDNGTLIDNTTSTASLIRRSKKKNKNPPAPMPVVPVDERVLWQEAGDTNTTFKQCINNGPVPSIADIKTLCSRVDTNYVIRRAGQTLPPPKGKNKNPNNEALAGPCVCKVWSYKSAVFSVCNCDTCEALIIPSGLRDKCREISQYCTTQGFSSGFIKMPETGAMYEQHMAEKGDKPDAKLRLGELSQGMERTCRSGDAQKLGQDTTGTFIQCGKHKNLHHAKKCWRVTDPENFWYIKDN
ncbi:uncharacterized protein RSE6_10146 [Rhynchosporium secalis]|uniref:Cyanovirin-N domain-containing protein n=1 Tax=Rhynchosporium secalis TaxID=38038 RepID=A0A1E1MJS6_RHYSE|nr:uncharacterized protein RSE6_10146 [Rhynchosporium secalis]